MPRYKAPNHSDCWIDCPGSGSAVYVDPPGICITECGEDGLARALLEVANLRVPKGTSKRISLKGRTDQGMLLSLGKIYNSLRAERTTFSRTFGPISEIANAVSNMDGTTVFEFSYEGSVSGVSKGLASSLNPVSDGDF